MLTPKAANASYRPMCQAGCFVGSRTPSSHYSDPGVRRVETLDGKSRSRARTLRAAAVRLWDDGVQHRPPHVPALESEIQVGWTRNRQQPIAAVEDHGRAVKRCG